MKVLLINGSARANGCTATALEEVEKVLVAEGITCEWVQVGNGPIRECIACGACKKLDKQCVFGDDLVNDLILKAKDADGFVFGSPVYFAHPSGRLLSILDRVFYAGASVFYHKPGMAVVSARRGGTTASVDVLNKYFTIAQMPIASSTYWNMVHGSKPEDVLHDLEGLQTMRNGAMNLAWLLKCIQLGKENGVCPPETKRETWTNFIR